LSAPAPPLECDPIAATNTGTPRHTSRPLRVSATVELVSLTVLIVNMATANANAIAALIGPAHGIAWLFGVITTWRDPRRTTGIAVLAAIPGIGGMLALRALSHAGQYEGIHDNITR
jgi:hypothetical protein